MIKAGTLAQPVMPVRNGAAFTAAQGCGYCLVWLTQLCGSEIQFCLWKCI